MKINHVHITNWKSPGQEFWKNVEDNPDQPLIEATIQMKLTFREYQDLLNRDERVVTAFYRP